MTRSAFTENWEYRNRLPSSNSTKTCLRSDLIHDNVIHIVPSCISVLRDEACKKAGECGRGHDLPELRKVIYMAEKARRAVKAEMDRDFKEEHQGKSERAQSEQGKRWIRKLRENSREDPVGMRGSRRSLRSKESLSRTPIAPVVLIIKSIEHIMARDWSTRTRVDFSWLLWLGAGTMKS